MPIAPGEYMLDFRWLGLAIATLAEALDEAKLRPADKFVRDAFSESNLPMRVDILHADDLPEGWEVRALAL
ncbi:MAG: hypothetical protein H7232_05785 [Aeromicrobium sp.]|nr:hypothetical protein [Burkholderiales bacterium]